MGGDIMANDLSGKRFGRLVVINRAPDNVSASGYRTAMWNCVCDCGNNATVRGKSLTGGATMSCGCLRSDRSRLSVTKHGGYGTRLYAIWISMRQRCLNKNNSAYKNYGGRGITICDEWNDFSSFKKWAEDSGYDDSANRGTCTLDRIDVNGNYTPDNCRWTTMREQSNNRRNSIELYFMGKTMTISDWAKELGVKYCTLWKRYKAGLDITKVLKK